MALTILKTAGRAGWIEKQKTNCIIEKRIIRDRLLLWKLILYVGAGTKHAWHS